IGLGLEAFPEARIVLQVKHTESIFICPASLILASSCYITYKSGKCLIYRKEKKMVVVSVTIICDSGCAGELCCKNHFRKSLIWPVRPRVSEDIGKICGK